MITMTCCDDTPIAFVLRADAPDVAAEPDGEDGWTPAVARIIGSIAQTLDAFPEALAAVQATIRRLRGGSP